MVLQTALEKAYANYLHSGRFPSCVLYITTRLGDVDVNVHPAKTEVKFVSDKQIFDGVYYAVLSALEKSSSGLHTGTALGAGLRENTQMSEASNIPSPSTNSMSLHENSRSSAPNFGSSKLSGSVVAKDGGFKNMSSDEFRKQYVSEDIKPYNNVKHLTHSNLNTQGLNQNSKIDAATDAPVSDISGSNTESVRLRVIGEALRTYIIVEYSSGVWFIDKHAAHERLHFNALKDEGFEPMSEALITPVICRLGAADAALLLENSKLLEGLGFEIESFGEDSVAARSIPAEIEIEDSESVLSDICELLKHGGFADAARLDDIYKTIACKAAIKAGKTSERFELEVLAKKVMSGEASHCPHGRPVAFEITKAQLDKGFKRI
jgi:DNA mismatch repair protein MutL